jgi:geranylgeranyl pyrophosphate synthase
MNAKDIFTSIAEPLDQVEQELQAQADRIADTWRADSGHSRYVVRTLRHLLHNPGKLLRPALVLLSAGLADPASLERSRRILVELATTVELIHSASLIHDDIIDDEKRRRGKAALHARFGNQTAVLVGDILYAQAFYLLTHLELSRWDQHRELFRLFCDTTRDMCIGEIVEQRVLIQRGREEQAKTRKSGSDGEKLNLPEYLEILRDKTAVLMSACCQSAAVACGASPDMILELSSFGMNFGLAFQLFDDHKDKDALISPAVDILAEGEQFLSRACTILEHFPASPYREELTRTCGFIASGVRIPG